MTTIILVPNLHCSSCSRSISEILWRLDPSPFSVSTSVVTQIVIITHSALLFPKDIVWALLKAEYEVDNIAIRDGAASIDPNIIFDGTEGYADLFLPDARRWLDEAQRVVRNFVKGGYGREHCHLKNCEQCRSEAYTKATPSGSSDLLIVPDESEPIRRSSTDERFRSSETGSLHLRRTDPSRLSHVGTQPHGDRDDDIQHSCTDKDSHGTGSSTVFDLNFPSSRVLSVSSSSRLIPISRDEAPLDPIAPIFCDPWKNRYEVVLSIGGMTCSACTKHVTETLQQFPFVKKVGINLMNNSGTVVFESTGDGEQEVKQLVVEIESVGFEASWDLIKNLSLSVADLEVPKERQITLSVNGMFCQKCPPIIVSALERTFLDLEVIIKPSIQSPLLRISYIPRLPDTTIRKIVDRIKVINPAFEVTVYHPPTLEERSMEIQRKERNNYLKRLAICTVCAIPTFLIGVVWMALVPETDKTRVFFEEPVWLGKVSRLEWSLMIISTPVMFFCAYPFHTRAIIEIIAMWRPESSVPLSPRSHGSSSMASFGHSFVSMFMLSAVLPLLYASRYLPDWFVS